MQMTVAHGGYKCQWWKAKQEALEGNHHGAGSLLKGNKFMLYQIFLKAIQDITIEINERLIDPWVLLWIYYTHSHQDEGSRRGLEARSIFAKRITRRQIISQACVPMWATFFVIYFSFFLSFPQSSSKNKSIQLGQRLTGKEEIWRWKDEPGRREGEVLTDKEGANEKGMLG